MSTMEAPTPSMPVDNWRGISSLTTAPDFMGDGIFTLGLHRFGSATASSPEVELYYGYHLILGDEPSK